MDDEYLDPLNWNPESMLGVPGILDVYRAGGITIANAPGTGIADDKALYSYMPEIVEFYCGEAPILKNVPTWRCAEPDALAYVLDHLAELVVKEVHGSGGYGMLVGPAASKAEVEAFRAKLTARPGTYIAQPTLSLSTVPILTEAGAGAAPRGSAALRAGLAGQGGHRAGGADAGGADRGEPGGELVPRRRDQGHLGAGGMRARSYRPARLAPPRARPLPTGGRDGASPCGRAEGIEALGHAPGKGRSSAKERPNRTRVQGMHALVGGPGGHAPRERDLGPAPC